MAHMAEDVVLRTPLAVEPVRGKAAVRAVVGLLKGRTDNGRRIGLRADMDALPIEEETNLAYRSTMPGTMHACGHDGPTTMLLGAARYLAETRAFDGTAVFIFQPAEEGLGGSRAMLKDGLFERFLCDEVYALHTPPGMTLGNIETRTGPALAAADFSDIRVRGKGTHAAMPHKGVDPILIAVALAQALQTIVSRDTDPLQSIVLPVTRMEAGKSYNVVPETAQLAGTIRTFDAAGLAAAFNAEIEVELRDIFSVLENAPAQTAAAVALAAELFGKERVDAEMAPLMGSEDTARDWIAPRARVTKRWRHHTKNLQSRNSEQADKAHLVKVQQVDVQSR